MSDSKVKAYGLVDLTRKQYLAIQSVGLVILLGGIVAFYVMELAASVNIWLRNLHYICLGILGLEIIETMVMLKKFRDKSA